MQRRIRRRAAVRMRVTPDLPLRASGSQRSGVRPREKEQLLCARRIGLRRLATGAIRLYYCAHMQHL